ncbi:MAG: hypothetical protein U0Q18_28460 [Bryobacteraceae bacterium]
MPPLLCRLLIRLASWIVPQRLRAAWFCRWNTGLQDWWILVERGELVSGANVQLARTLRVAFTDAFWLRCNRAWLAYWLRSAGFVFTCYGASLLALGVLSSGFGVTRSLIEIAFGIPVRRILPQGPTGTLIAYCGPIVFALAAGTFLVAIGRLLALNRRSWRSWAFLTIKSLGVMAITSLLWIEGGTTLRAHIRNPELRIFVGGVGLALLFIVLFGCGLLWSFEDQRRRCPVCLRLLGMPVAIGSWGSMFEPAVTELLCDEGHGALCISERGAGAEDRWTALDASWRELFVKQ